MSIYIYIYVNEDLALECIGFIVIMKKDRYIIIHKLMIIRHRVVM